MKKLALSLVLLMFCTILSAQSLNCSNYGILRIKSATNDLSSTILAELRGNFYLTLHRAPKAGWWVIEYAADNYGDIGYRGRYVYCTHICVKNRYSGVSMFSSPSTRSGVVYTFRDAYNSLYPIDKRNGWTKVRTTAKGREGWVMDSQLTY